MFSSNAFPSLSNDSTIFFFSCRHHLQQVPQQHPFLTHFQQEQQGVQGRLLSVAAAAWKGPRPSDHNKSSRRSTSIRRDDDDDGNHPPLVGYAKVFTTVEEKMGGSEGRGSSDTVESETWNQGSSRTPVLKGCKKKLGKRDHDRRRASNGASKSYVEEERSEAGREGGRSGGGAELGFPLQRRKPWSAAAARNAAPAAGGNSIQRNNHERISGGSEKKSSFRTGSAHHHNNTGQLLQERRRTEQSSSLKSCWPNNFMIPAAEVENLSLSTQGNAAAAADNAQVVAVLDKEEVALREALKIRRKNTAEALCAALQAAKMSPRYSREVVAKMPAFVDQIMLEAVALKGDSKFVTSSFASRARACIDRTKVVESIKWLKHNSVTMPRVGKLVDLKMENLQVLCERVAWLKHMHVHGRDLGVVLTRQPCILNRPQAELDELIGLLERAGIRREWVGFVISRSPAVLSLSSQELIKKLLFFENLGVTPQQLGPMAFNFPASIGHFHIDEMQTKVEYFRRLGLADPNIGRAIATRPQLLACSIDAAWRPLVKYLRFLGVETTGLQRIICVNPSVFCFNLENNIAPKLSINQFHKAVLGEAKDIGWEKVRFLRAIGVHEEAIGKVIVEFPAFLSFSLDRKIRPVVRFLLETAGVTEENVGKVIALQPRLIGCSMSNKLQPLVEYFLNHQLRRDQLGTMVADFPMLLKYNVSIIKPKLEYFKRVLALPFDDLIAFPRYFSYSLQGRINPRYRILRAKGLMFNLRYMLACSDDLFNQRVEAALQGHAIEASDEVDDIEGAYEDASGAHFPTDDDSVYAYAYHSCGDDTEADEEYGSETEGDEDMSAATFLKTHD